jgi:hypothetical protein
MATMRLGAFADALAGKTGNTVFVRGTAGITVRDYVIPENPRTPAQEQTRSAFSWAVGTWNNLSPGQAQAWRDYAETLAVREPGSGAIRTPRARDLFIGLAIKVRQVDPNAEIPLTPPESRFFGDAIGVRLGPPAPGAVVFEATGPNSAGVVTELLLQRLPLAGSRPYETKYRTQGFMSFDGEPVAVEAPPGWYAAAYRFVKAATGQATLLAPLGPVQVLASWQR